LSDYSHATRPGLLALRDHPSHSGSRPRTHSMGCIYLFSNITLFNYDICRKKTYQSIIVSQFGAKFIGKGFTDTFGDPKKVVSI